MWSVWLSYVRKIEFWHVGMQTSVLDLTFDWNQDINISEPSQPQLILQNFAFYFEYSLIYSFNIKLFSNNQYRYKCALNFSFLFFFLFWKFGKCLCSKYIDLQCVQTRFSVTIFGLLEWVKYCMLTFFFNEISDIEHKMTRNYDVNLVKGMKRFNLRGQFWHL